MELKILHEALNPLFKRKEIKGIIHADSPPSRLEFAKKLSEKYSVPYTAVKVLEIKGNFGVREFKFQANIYSSKEERDKIELMSKKEKDIEAKSLQAEKPTEEKSVEVNTNA